jgi:hypothetical protein
MGGPPLRRAVLGATTAAGLGLLGGGAAGVLGLDGDLRAAERPVHPQQQRFVRDQVVPCRPPARAPRRALTHSARGKVKL